VERLFVSVPLRELSKAYGHIVTVNTFGYSFDSMVYFAAFETFTRNVLGDAAGSIKFNLGWSSMRAHYISAVMAFSLR